MMEDPIVEEVRKHRAAHAAKYNNDLAAICKALKLREKQSKRKVVNRQPRAWQAQKENFDMAE